MQNNSIFLIAGLGNPGKEYQNTRHNIGFLILDFFLEKINRQNNTATNFNLNKKHHSKIAIFKNQTQTIILAKPQKFMNLSGLAIKSLLDFYKIPLENILVIQDDSDLPFGKIRFSKNSSAGGHNGIKSIIQELTDQNFARLRFGIANEKKLLLSLDKFVLENFTPEEKNQINQNQENLIFAIESFIKNGFQKTTGFLEHFN